MSWTKIKSDGRGGYNVHENWTSGDETMDKIFPIFLGIAMAAFLSLIFPIILWIQSPLNDHKQNYQATYFGILASVLLLSDVMFGGLFWGISTHTGHVEVMEFFASLHIGFLIINIGLLIAYKNDVIYFDAFDVRPSMIIFYVLALVISIYGYDMFHSIAESIASETPMDFYKDYHYEQMEELARGL